MAEFTEREKLNLIRNWPQSGLSQKLFSKEHGLSYNQFQYIWRRKIKHKSRRNHYIKRPMHEGFISLPAPSSEFRTKPIMELHLPNGKQLKIYQDISVTLLKSLLS
jgi:hypothetical protein